MVRQSIREGYAEGRGRGAARRSARGARCWPARAACAAALLLGFLVVLPARGPGRESAAGAGWLSVVSVAQAQPPGGAKVEAKAKLQRGAQLLQQGEFAQALAQFKEAYELVPSPKIYFNFGIAYVGMARYSEALESFEHFIQEAKEASPGSLADARQQIENLTGKVERVRVSSDRDGAEVSIDGRSYGLTPLAHPLYVDPGAHQLVVQDHDRPLIQNFTAFAGKEGSLVMRFKVTAEKADRASPPPNLRAPPPPENPVGITGGPETEPLPPRPFYKRAWFWGAVGVLVAGGVVAALVVTRKTSYPDPSLGSLPGN
jgi:hypothetical protein